MTKRLCTVACFLGIQLMPINALHAQQHVAPPPAPADSGPTLEATMKFIQDNLEEGKLTYTAFVSDASQPGVEWKNQFKVEMTHLAADAKTCRISFHWRAEVNGKVSDDTDYNLALKDVKSIVVLPQEQNQHQVDTRGGHPEWTSRIEPNLFTLVARRPKGLENAFLFSDEEMADRIAKALVHAVELCGGGNKDPF
jgi:hypothetical protein